MASRDEEASLQVSPYTSEICEISFKGGQLYHVHQHLLTASEKLASRMRSCSRYDGRLARIDMPDISHSTGHVIIHFLYCGSYQFLEPRASNKADKTEYELRVALNVHIAAVSLKLSPLQALTEREILRLSEQLNLISVLDIVEHSGLSLEEIPMLATYLQSRVLASSFGSSQESTNELLLKLATPNTVSKMLFKSMIVLGGTALCQGSIAQQVQVEHSMGTELHHQGSSEQDLAVDIETQRHEEEIASLLEKKAKRGRLLKSDRARLDFLERRVSSESAIEASKCSIRLLTLDAQTVFSQIIEEQEIVALLQQFGRDGRLPITQQERLKDLRAKKAKRSLSQEASKVTSSNCLNLGSSGKTPRPCASPTNEPDNATLSPSADENVSFFSGSTGQMTPTSCGQPWESPES